MAIVCTLLLIYILLLVGRSLLSWFPASRTGPMATVGGFLMVATDPVLKPMRQLVKPVRMGNAMIDVSSLIVVLGLVVLRNLLCS